jgi:cell division septum initiation protein DivIVA
MREQAGLIEAKRLQDTKVRVQKQIDELKRKVQNKDFSKKSSKTLLKIRN